MGACSLSDGLAVRTSVFFLGPALKRSRCSRILLSSSAPFSPCLPVITTSGFIHCHSTFMNCLPYSRLCARVQGVKANTAFPALKGVPLWWQADVSVSPVFLVEESLGGVPACIPDSLGQALCHRSHRHQSHRAWHTVLAKPQDLTEPHTPTTSSERKRTNILLRVRWACARRWEPTRE